MYANRVHRIEREGYGANEVHLSNADASVVGDTQEDMAKKGARRMPAVEHS